MQSAKQVESRHPDCLNPERPDCRRSRDSPEIDLEGSVADVLKGKIEHDFLQAPREKSDRKQQPGHEFHDEVFGPDNSQNRLQLQGACPDQKVQQGKYKQGEQATHRKQQT